MPSGSSGSSSDFPINISVTQTGLDQVTAQLTRFSEMLKTAGSTMQQQISQMNSLGSAFSNFGKSSSTLNSSISQTSNSLKTLGPAAQSAGSAMTGAQSKMTSFMDATKVAGTSATQAANSIKTIGPATQSATSAAGSAAAEFNALSNSERLVSEATTQTAASFKTLAPSVTQTATGMTELTAETNLVSTSMQKTAEGTILAADANKTLGQSTVAATEGQNMLTETQMQNDDVTTKATASHGKFGDQIISNAKHVSALGMSFLMLNNSQSGNEVIQGNIIMQQEKIAEDTKKLSAAIQEYGKNSRQATQAQQALDKDTRALRLDQREANAELHNMIFMYAMIGTEIMSSALPALIHMQETITNVKTGVASFREVMSSMPDKLASLWTKLNTVFDALVARIAGVTTATEASTVAQTANAVSTEAATAATVEQNAATEISTGIKGLSTDATIAKTAATEAEAGVTTEAAAATDMYAMAGKRLLVTLGPIGLAIGAVAAVYEIFSTNAFGSRDAAEAFGKSIGDTVPVLQPFLEGLQGVAGQLGMTGETAEQTKQHMDNAAFGFQHMSTLWNDTVANMQQSNNTLVKTMGDTAAVLGVDMNKAMGDLQNQVRATTNTWGLFVDALKKGDYKGAVDIIASSFSALPGIFSRIFSDVQNTLVDFNEGFNKAFDTVAGTIKDVLQNQVLPAVVGIATEIGSRFIAALTTAFSQMASWATTNIVTPIQTTVNGIATGVQEVGKAVWTKLGLDQLVAFAVPMINNLATGISNVANFVKEAAAQVWIKLNLNDLIIRAVPLVSALGKGISAVAQFVANVASDVWKALHLDDLLDSATNLGKGIANNISAGLKGVVDLLNGVGQAAGGVGKAITDFANNPLGLGQAQGQTNAQPKAAQNPITSVAPKPPQTTQPTMNNGTKSPVDTGKPQSNNPFGQVTPQSGTQPKAGFQQTAFTQQVPKITSSGNTNLTAGLQAQNKALLANASAAQQAADAQQKLADQNKAADAAVTELTTKNDKLQTTITGNSLALGQNKLQSELARQGYLGQSEALQKLEMDNVANQAALIAFNQQLATGEMQGAAFTNAVLTQELALKKNEQAVSDLQGTTAAMTDEYLRGESGVNQYNLAFEEQRQIFASNLTEGQKLNGTLAALNEGVSNHIATVEAFNKGYAQQKIDMVTAQVAISEYQGKLIALGQDLQTGYAQHIAYMQGTLKTREAILTSVSALDEERGSVAEMGAALATQLPQWVAYTKGQLDAQKASQDYQVALAGAVGQLEYLNQHLTDTNTAVTQYNTGFIQAATEVAGWVQKINEGTGAIDGHAKEVEYLANLYHVTLPQGFNFTQQQFDDWVKAAMGDNDLLSKSFSDSAKAGADMIQKIADNFKNGKVDLGKAVKELADETGLKFTGALKDAVKPELVADAIKKPMTAGLNLMADIGTVGPAADSIVKQYTGMIADNIKKSPELAQAGQSLMQILNDPQRITDPAKWLFQLKAGLDAYGQGLTPATQSTNDLMQAISSISDPAKTSNSAVTGLQTALNNYIKYGANSSKSTADLAAAFNQLGINGQGASELLAKLGITGPKAAQVLSEINAAATPAGDALTGVGTGASTSDPLVAAFQQTLAGMAPIFGEIGGVAQQVFEVGLPLYVNTGVGAMTTAFATILPSITPILGQLQSMAQQTFTIIGQQAILVTQGVNTAYQQAQGDARGYLATIQSSSIAAWNAIGQAAIVIATSVNQDYATAEKDALGYLQSMQKEADTTFKAIGTSAVQVPTGVNTAYKTAEADAKGYLNTMQTDANNVFKAIATSSNQVAVGVNNAFRTADQDAEGSLNNLRSAADSTFQDIISRSGSAGRAIDGIGNSARAATGAVNQLAAAINGLRDKTVTIHVQQQGSIPGGFAGQFGLNMLVDKPTQFLAGEGMGKERVKIAPGTMGFVEDLSKELREKFGNHGQYSGTSSGFGGLGGLGAHISEWVNDFLENLFNSIGWPFPGHGGGSGGGTGGGGNNPPPHPQNINLSPNMLNAFGPFPVNSPHAWEQSNVITPQTTTLPPDASGSGSGTSSGSSSGGSTSQTNTNTNSNTQNNSGNIIQTNTSSQISNIPGASNTNSNVNINTSSGSQSSSTSQTSQGTVKVIRETSVPITLELEGTPLMKTILKLISQEMSNAGVYG